MATDKFLFCFFSADNLFLRSEIPLHWNVFLFLSELKKLYILVGICKVQLTCNASSKMEIDRLSFSFFRETIQNKTDMTNLARSDNRVLDHLLISDFETPLIEKKVALVC